MYIGGARVEKLAHFWPVRHDWPIHHASSVPGQYRLSARRICGEAMSDYVSMCGHYVSLRTQFLGTKKACVADFGFELLMLDEKRVRASLNST